MRPNRFTSGYINVQVNPNTSCPICKQSHKKRFGIDIKEQYDEDMLIHSLKYEMPLS